LKTSDSVYIPDYAHDGRKTCSQEGTKCFNILSIDGGGIRGIIPTYVVEYMEEKAYEYAEDQEYTSKDDYPEEKIPMHELFDMIAGSSTGSILAAALVTPEKNGSHNNAYWAEDVRDVFYDDDKELFTLNHLPYALIVLFTLIGAALGGFLGYRYGIRIFDNKELEEAHEAIRDYIKKAKKAAHGKDRD
jgi:hypothetical protein